MGTAGADNTHMPISPEFDGLVQQAIAHPSTAEFQVFWELLVPILEQLPQSKRLHVAGEAIAQLATVCAARATWLLDGWQSKYTPAPSELIGEPVLTDDMLAGVLRHTMSLNLDEILESLELQQRSGRSHPDDSLAEAIDKDALLEMLDQISAKQSALETAYEESISDWSGTVREWLQVQPQPVDMGTVFQNVHLSPVRVWLGLLLGTGYQWEHRWQTEEEFYRPANIRVSCQPSVELKSTELKSTELKIEL
jgi:hypothetical protein